MSSPDLWTERDSLVKLREQVSFFVQRPDATRRTFAVVKRTRDLSGHYSYKTLSLEKLEASNKLLKGGVLDCGQVEREARALVRQLYAQHKPPTLATSSNLALLDDYWEKKYKRRRLVTPRSSYNGLRRAVEALGHVSLLSGTEEEIQREVDKRYRADDNRQIALVGKLREMLKFYGRTDVVLISNKWTFAETSHLTLEEFERAIRSVDDRVLRTLSWVAFTTGMRVGEIFGVRQSDYVRGGQDRYVRVSRQLDKNLKLRELKNRKPHNTFVLKEGWEHLDKWLVLPEATKRRYRNVDHAKVLKLACAGARLPDEKCIVFHALRHSYAIHLAKAGVSLEVLAKLLGDSFSTVERYYADYVARDETMERVGTILARRSEL